MPIKDRPLFKTGASLAVTLPKPWTRRFRLRAGDRVEFEVNDNNLVIKAKKREKKEKV